VRCDRVKRILMLALGLLLAPLAAEAQQAGKVPQIGYLTAQSPDSVALASEAFRQGLQELGYVEGKTIVIAYRFAEEKRDRLPELAAELVRLKVDLIVAHTASAARAAKQATQTIPIVMVGVGWDPVETGLVESLARPGGNLTGLTNLGLELSRKRLELLTEIVPRGSRVAVLWDGANPANRLNVHELETAAHALGLTVQAWEVQGTEDFERLFAALTQERPDALYVAGGPLMGTNRKRIADFAFKSRLPSVYEWRGAVEDGGLMSYGPNGAAAQRRAASYVDKILKGAKPGDLPVEQPTKFELILNLRTAQALGVTFSPTLLLLADEMIK
jgi:putative tryptophan/tyrosine transport system substrate-binding protein